MSVDKKNISPERSSPSAHAADLARLKGEIGRLKESFDLVKREQVEYLQNVSHQLVAPLNAMKWHIENLTSGRLSVERAKKVLKSIYSQATIAVHLAKNFALMSNLEADHSLKAMTEPVEEVDVRTMLINVSNDFQPLGWEKGIKLVVHDESFKKQSEVYAIKPLINQVFSNIIENAIKYSEADSTINIERVDHAQTDVVVVEVINVGIGIHEDDTKRIFERGFRSERAQNKYPAGTGFGLYIAEKIIAIHKGDITASMNAQSETVFKVSLWTDKLKGKKTK